jgi:peptidyl-prolyl cis-trans isomerase B (cyclophilin B)
MRWRQYAFPAVVLGVAAIAVIVIVIANSGGDDEDGKSQAGQCREVPAPQPKDVKETKPRFRLARGEKYVATVVTSCGTFAIQLDSKEAPRTGGSFVSLARNGFYDGLSFHRVVPGFVVQGGDPAGNGSGGPGYKIRERPPNDVVYSEGTVAMAKGGNEPAGTSGSQFFVVTGDNANLPPDYALVGKVTKGLDVVHAIESLAGPDAPAQGGPPTQAVVIDKITVAGG